MIPLNLAELVEVTGGELHGCEDGRRGRRRRRDHGLAGVRTGQPLRRPGRRVRRRPLRPGRRGGGRRGGARLRPIAGVPTIAVDDVQTAFGRLGRGVVDRAPGVRVVGITGSSGKTTTKDLLASVLSTAGETVAPLNSLNGEIGVPLTVCRIRAATRYLVVEMGAGIGHVEYLTHIAPPHVAIVLNVGTAHVGEFGSRQHRARQVGAAQGGASGRPVHPQCRRSRRRRDGQRPAVARPARRSLAWCGGARGGRCRRQAGQSGIRPHRPGGARRCRCSSAVPTVANSLAVAAAALELGMPLDRVAAALSAATPVSRWRMEITERPDGVVVVNDAYNANPTRCARRSTRSRSSRRRERGGPSSAGCSSSGRTVTVSTPPSGRMPPGWVSTTSWRSATGRGPTAPSSGFRTSTRPTSSSRHASSRATSCCSSRAATAGYGGSVTGSPARRVGEGRRAMEAAHAVDDGPDERDERTVAP